jgi:hypothetical protein
VHKELKALKAIKVLKAQQDRLAPQGIKVTKA